MNELIFDGHKLRVIERNGQSWLTAADIAAALGYSRSDKVSRLYQLHDKEFRPSMTDLIVTPVSGFSGITAEARVFSLRGAHLIGMFARTKKGAEFRTWVLDQLEAQVAPARSLMFAWFEAKAAVDAQDKFASLCGKGLSEHKQKKHPLKEKLNQISGQIQPSLLALTEPA
ncbi:BRO family protein [Janthinobacterium sp. HLS12-2]|uniref:BRO family protein n=1 Tax=Janthinobacterium sp. HLS12-2 TaxID=1259324 RepID=UPI003F23C313